MIQQATTEFRYRGDIHRLRIDAHRLVAARYFVFTVAVGMLLWLAAQVLFLGGDVSGVVMARIVMVSIFGAGLVWVVTDKEIRLLRQLEDKNGKLAQRERETKALNRLAQDHFADCFAQAPPYQAVPMGPNHDERPGVLVTLQPDDQPDFKIVSGSRRHAGYLE